MTTFGWPRGNEMCVRVCVRSVREGGLRSTIGSVSGSMLRPAAVAVASPLRTKLVSASEYTPRHPKERPLSPHLTIYNWGISNGVSAGHRITGFALTGVVYLSALGLAAKGHDVAYWTQFAKDQHMILLPALLKFGIAFPLSFHTLNGLRHLGWDSGKWLEVSEMFSTGKVVLGASAVLGLAALFI